MILQLLLADGDGINCITLKSGILAGITACDSVNHVHAAGNLPKNGEAAVQGWHRYKRDEELAAVGIAAGIGHGNHPGFVEFQVAVLVDKFISGAAAAGAGWVAALGHEILKYPVKRSAIKVSLARQEDKTIERDGGFGGVELNHKLAAFCHFDGGGILF